MADSKVSELTAATSAAGADSLYLVQSSTSKSITVANLFATVSTPVQFTNTVQIGDHQTMTAAGAISPNYNVTYINDPSGAGACSIGTGLDGQIHIVIMSSNSGGHSLTLSGANVQGTITLDAAGDSATLLYDTGLSKWYFIGGSATIS
jgi:hypothetical protein